MKKRHARLLQLLKEKEGRFLSGRELGEQLGVSDRTIRNDIRILNEDYLINAEIVSNNRLGYKLRGTLTQFNKRSHLDLDYHKRAFQLVKELLDANGWMSYDKFAETHFVSPQTIHSDVMRMSEWLKQYDRKAMFETKPFCGIRLLGNEQDKRMLLTSLFNNEFAAKQEAISQMTTAFSGWHTPQSIADIGKKLSDVLDANSIYVSASVWAKLLAVVLVAVHRGKTHELSTNKSAQAGANWKLAEQIANAIGWPCCPDGELAYLASNCIAFKLLPIQKNGNAAASERLQAACLAGLSLLEKQYGVDLIGDQKLLRHLTLHLQNMLSVLQDQYEIEAPSLSMIKAQYIHAFQMAVVFAEELGEKLSISVPEAEVSYLALHLQAAIDRMERKPIRVPLISTKSLAMTTLMKQKVEQAYPQVSIQEIYIPYAPSAVPRDAAFVLTTSKELKTQHKTLYIEGDFITKEDIARIKECLTYGILQARVTEDCFFRLNGQTKEELLRLLVKKAGAEVYLPSIESREQLSATDIGNRMAVPHPLISIDAPETKIFVGMNSRAVQWGERTVQMVFLLLVSERDTVLYESIFREIYQLSKTARLQDMKSYQGFRNSLSL